MAEPENATFGEPVPNGADTAPTAGVISQYVKDFSFENPNAPTIFQTATSPQIEVNFNIGYNKVGDEVYEVALKIEVRATSDANVAFIVDLTYAALFGIRNVPEEQIEPFLLGEGPRIIFPFARRIVADAVRDGGFPIPLLLEPIDFGGIYMQRQQAQAEAAAQGAGQA